jgi:hypothetical protein
MSALSDDYTKKFSSEKKAIFNKKFSDDYDPNMSERSNIIRILGEMRELGLADGGRIGLKDGLGSFTTNDPTEAFKEVINRIISKNVKGTTLPITDNISLNLGPKIDEVELGGILEVLGGELSIGGGLKGDDKGIGFSFKKEFNKGGRVAYQDGTPERKDYETPVTDVIKSVNETSKDFIIDGMGAFDRYTGVDQINKENFPGSFDDPSGIPSDFRHQAAANALAKGLGKGQYTDPIMGPISYLSGALGSSGLGAIKEIGDLAVGLYDNPKNYKDVLGEFVRDNLSNIKGAFAYNKTSEELYDELMKDYVPKNNFDMLPIRSRQMFLKQKQLQDAKTKDKVITPIKKPTRTVTGTTKPGTGGGGGDGTFGVGSDGQKSFDSGQGFGINATTGGPVSNKTGKGRTDYTLGGLARMLGE